VPRKAQLIESTIDVAAAVIINTHGQVLLSLRKPETHQGGKWEFPGGKFEAGETAELALQRELREELGIDVGDTEPFLEVSYRYPEKSVQLHVLRVLSYEGTPCGLEGQKVEWFDVDRLAELEFPDANYPILEKLVKVR